MFERRNTLESEIFFCEQARELLKDKYILIIGDSVQRCVYKDLIALLEDGCLMTESEKRSKMEHCYRGDRVVACRDVLSHAKFAKFAFFAKILRNFAFASLRRAHLRFA
ncbi:unnamed protein product [Oikopleura dioica]|uniref:Uncharacterized protein n=1 Tax=Oikopleura dioica TaxID=34765 RepID=E4Z5Z3_OIKDI|nr:unnamed protein product [Oikopleura dioica]